MFSNRFVTSIVVDGLVISERVDGQVSIPFQSKFGIKLTNKHSRRAQAEVFIDEISQGIFIVDAGKSWTLLRSEAKNRAFKFVKTTSDESRKAGKSNLPEGVSGLVRVVWQLEKEYVPYVPPKPVQPQIPYDPYDHDPWKKTLPWKYRKYPYYPYYPTIYGGSPDTAQIRTVGATYSTNSCAGGVIGQSVCSTTPTPKDNPGVTVDGGITNQEFETILFIPEEDKTIHLIKLVGYEGEPPAPKLYCPNCGKKTEKRWRHCPFCSQKL